MNTPLKTRLNVQFLNIHFLKTKQVQYSVFLGLLAVILLVSFQYLNIQLLNIQLLNVHYLNIHWLNVHFLTVQLLNIQLLNVHFLSIQQVNVHLLNVQFLHMQLVKSWQLPCQAGAAGGIRSGCGCRSVPGDSQYTPAPSGGCAYCTRCWGCLCWQKPSAAGW